MSFDVQQNHIPTIWCNILDWTLQCTRTQFLYSYWLAISLMNFTSHYETGYYYLQRHSSLTPVYLYIHKMNLTSHYETEYYNLQGHRSLTPIHLYIHKMNFDILRIRNSSPHVNVHYSIQWRSVNCTLSYDIVLAHRKTKWFVYFCEITILLFRLCGQKLNFLSNNQKQLMWESVCEGWKERIWV